MVVTCIGSISIAGDDEGWDGCPVGEMTDCNGNCAPFAWLQDDICDDGQREWPEGSGIYIDFSCENYFCDIYNCDGCDSACPSGEVPDCNGNCAPVTMIADGICDLGQRTWNGNAIVFACGEYACDLADCSGVCWDDPANTEGLQSSGACCIDGDCVETTQYDCWSNNGIWMGSHTLCQTNTCECGDGWTADCNGNCIPLGEAAGGWCADGEIVDYGDGPFTIDLNCLALACGVSNCLGVCPGACCTEGDCLTISYDDCLDYGGVFLGSNQPCSGECDDQQRYPIQLPESILTWSGALGEVGGMPQTIATGGNILVSSGHTINSPTGSQAICVFRWDTDHLVEEQLLLYPDGLHGVPSCVSTDGQRIAFTVETIDEGKGYHREVRIYAHDGSQWILEQNIIGAQAIDYQTTFSSSLDIDGNILVVGDTSFGYDEESNDGGAHVYRFNEKSWVKDSTVLIPFGSTQWPSGYDRQLGTAVAVSDGIAAVASNRSIFLFNVSENPSTNVQHVRLNGDWPATESIDLEGNRLISPAQYYDQGSSDNLGAIMYEFDGSDWVETAIFSPFDITGSDWAGYIMDLDGDRVLMTSPRDNDLGLSTGSAYVWDFDGTDWVFSAKLWSDRATGGQEFGSLAALLHGKAYIAEHPWIGEADRDGIRVFGERGIAWINPNDASISDPNNWDPQAPVSGDTVSFSLRSQTRIAVDEDPVFDLFNVGPGTPIFDMINGADRAMGSGIGDAIVLGGVSGLPASLGITNGTLTVNGDVRLGKDGRSAKIFVLNEAGPYQGQLVINGFYEQTDAGELEVELEHGQPAPVQITSVAPRLAGVLSLTIADDYIPQVGDLIPIVSTEFVDAEQGGTEQWNCVVVKDPLPEGLYLKITYSEEPPKGDPYSVSAEVDSLENFFGYGDPNSASITGNATDVAVADLGTSSARGLDGFDDIVATTEDTIYVFMSDGNGGFASYYSFTNSGSPFVDLSSVDIGDIDGDGTTDIVVTSAGNDTVIPIFNVTGNHTTLSIGTAVPTASNPSSVLLLDLDAIPGDEIAVACAGESVTEGQIDFFTTSTTLNSGITPLGSLDTPGNPDDIASSLSPKDDEEDWFSITLPGSKKVAKGSGSSSSTLTWSFELESITDIGVSPTQLSVGDLNGDGFEDLVATCPEADVVSVLTGDANGVLSSALLIDVGNLPRSITLLDYDRDGDLDIAVVATSEETNNRAVFVYRNDTSLNGGNLLFALDLSLDDGLSPVLVAKGDIDGDGGDDLISINTVSSLRGAGNQLRVRKVNDGVCASDLDSDGNVGVQDLLMVIAAWGFTGPQPEDLNSDGTVDVLDLLILIASWGPCVD